MITGEQEKTLIQFSKSMVEWLEKRIAGDKLLKKGLLHLGVYPAPIERIKNKYRWQVLIRIRTDDIYRFSFHLLAKELLNEFYNETFNIALDFNPLSLI